MQEGEKGMNKDEERFKKMLFFAKREPLRFLPTAKLFLFQKTAQSLERGRRAFSTHNGQQRPTTRKEAFSNPQNRSIRIVLYYCWDR